MLATDGVAFDPTAHKYSLNGKDVPGVTTVISWLNRYAGVPEAIMEEARERGDAVHLATALYDLDNLDDSSVHEVVAPYLDAWKRFRSDTGFVPELIERRVFSHRHFFAGTLDRVGTLGEGNRALIDIKTTAKVMPGNGPQTAAYKQALIDEGYPESSNLRRYTVLLCPDAKIPYRIAPHVDPNDLNVFLSSLNLHNWRKNNRVKD